MDNKISSTRLEKYFNLTEKALAEVKKNIILLDNNFVVYYFILKLLDQDSRA